LRDIRRAAFCIICGGDSGPLDLHAEDYSRAIYWEPEWRIPACYRCHMIVHSRHFSRAGFDTYRAELRAGRRWPPLPNRSFPTVVNTHLRANNGRRRGVEEFDPKLWVIDGQEFRPWRTPVLDMIASGSLCPPGREHGNSWSASPVTPRSELTMAEQLWRIDKVIKSVEVDRWLPIVEARISERRSRRMPFRAPSDAELQLLDD
jgi:hypothetical protein